MRSGHGRVVVAVLCGLLMSMTLAASAAAKPLVLNLDEGTGHGSITPGQEVRLVTERPVVFESSKGTVECADQSDFTAFFGHLTKNDATKDEISLESGGFMFGESCSSTIFLAPSAEVEPLDLPWNVVVTASGAVKITGSPEVAIDIHFSGTRGYHCVYEKPTLTGSVVPTPVAGTEQQMTLAVTHRGLHRNQIYDSPLCPGTVYMTAEIPEVIGATEYIYDSLT